MEQCAHLRQEISSLHNEVEAYRAHPLHSELTKLRQRVLTPFMTQKGAAVFVITVKEAHGLVNTYKNVKLDPFVELKLGNTVVVYLFNVVI